MDADRISIRLLSAIKKFGNTRHYKVLSAMSEAYIKGDTVEFNKVYATLPSEKELLERLIKKLKNKSTYTGLKKILEGKDLTLEQQKIALSSLFTHIVIEEKDNPDYVILEKIILNKLEELVL